MKPKIGLKILCLSMVVALSACTTVKQKISDLDFIKLPEFREDAENIGNYLSVANAPQTPTDVRSDAAWDNSVRELIAVGNSFKVPDGEPVLSETEIEQKMQMLRAQVDEYKRDDPQ
ncbi:MAG: hypothetical protein COA43_03635 [Robiginitomaculum sp.]|nr:MAG: hypothetical protein COA43_03635 [Robiginitomaculum sp.]